MMFSISFCFFFILFILVLNFNESKIENRTLKTFENQHMYQISDNLKNARETNYFKEKDSYKRLNDFNQALVTSKKFTVYTAVYQPMEVIDFKGDASFSPDYEMDAENPAPRNQNGRFYYSIQSLLVNDNALTMNHIQLSEGKYFKKEVYTYKKHQIIPILLGADYEGVYKVGETVDISYYFEDFKGKIIGFIKQDEKIMTSNSPETNLNKFFVMPVLHFEKLTNEQVRDSQFENVFFRANLFATMNSRLMTKASPLQVREYLADISDETNFYDFNIIGADGVIMDSLFQMSKVNLQLILAINILILASVMTIIYALLKMKIRYNRESFLVLLISGLDYRLIKRYIFREIAYLIAWALIGSVVVAACISFLLNDYKLLLYDMGWGGMAYVFLLICCKYLVNKGFQKINIIEMLKRG